MPFKAGSMSSSSRTTHYTTVLEACIQSIPFHSNPIQLQTFSTLSAIFFTKPLLSFFQSHAFSADQNGRVLASSLFFPWSNCSDKKGCVYPCKEVGYKRLHFPHLLKEVSHIQDLFILIQGWQ